MPNAFAHRAGAAAVIGTVVHQHEKMNGQSTHRPAAAAGLAAMCGTLPDVIEPAFHPNHRQFFHSVSAFGLVGWGLYKLSNWEPTDGFERALKFTSMVAGGAYLVHLIMDSTTPKGLPLIGK